MKTLSRRQFGQTLPAGMAALATWASSELPCATAQAAEVSYAEGAQERTILRSVKWGMIELPEQGEALARKRFELCKTIGLDGMELVSPGAPSIDLLRQLSRETALPIHGLVNMKHWQVRMSSPKAAVRDQAVAIQKQAIVDAAGMGANTVLLVPAAKIGSEATHQEAWDRSIACIRQCLPTASRYGVRILIENVWNQFCEQPETLRDYIDAIDSPWVGVYFDIGNAQKFAPSEHWVRTLGSRIVKLDVKDWGMKAGFCKLGDGDVNWAAVREALNDIGFSGWSTAEVQGGNPDRIREIAQRMENVLYG